MSVNRQLYIDNLRLLMIVLVVLQHIAVTYSGMGGWYYIEPSEMDIVQTVAFGFHQAFTQGYFMGFLFLIAGYYTPQSYDKKGFCKFIKDRFVRLGIPTIIYMLVIHPILVFNIMGYRLDVSGGFIAPNDGSLLTSYVGYFTGLHVFSGTGPLWFTLALLVFSVVYATIRKCIAHKPLANVKKFPKFSNITVLILLISVCAFLIRIVQPRGTDVLNMQLAYFSQYIILFVVGIYSKRFDWFEKLDYVKGKHWLICGMLLGFVLFAVIHIAGGALDGDFEPFDGGLTWQSAAFAVWESFVSVAMAIGLLALFKEKFNRQSELVKRLSQNAFSVYVFHSLIIVSLSLLFAPVNLLPIVKFAIVAVIGIPTCFLITDLTIQRIPFLRMLFS